MMYSIANKFDNAFDLVAYVISAMTDSGYMPCDVDEFLNQAIGKGNYNLLVKSSEIIEECNKVIKEDKLYNDIYDDNWRDHYYGSDEEFLFDSIDDYSNYNYNNNEFNSNEDDDFELQLNKDCFGDDDAYEGFDSCHNHYYNSLDPLDKDDEFADYTYAPYMYNF